MKWFSRRPPVQPEPRLVEPELAPLIARANEVLERARADAERRERIATSTRRIAEQLYSTYRLASIITNAPGPEERFETLDGLLVEAQEAATKIEDWPGERR